jgi:hypothetical protein
VDCDNIVDCDEITGVVACDDPAGTIVDADGVGVNEDGCDDIDGVDVG